MHGGILSPGMGDTFLNVDLWIEGGCGFSGMAGRPYSIHRYRNFEPGEMGWLKVTLRFAGMVRRGNCCRNGEVVVSKSK